MASVQDDPAWINALRMLHSIASTSIGPAGRPKLIRPHGQCSSVTVTSVSHRLFGNLKLSHPIGRVVQQLLVARQARGSDGGLLTVLLACRLILSAHERRLPARLCASLLPEVLACSVRAVLGEGDGSQRLAGGGVPYLPASAPLRMSDMRSLLAVVRAVLAPKRVAFPGAEPEDIERLAVLLVSAFVRSLPDGAAAATANPSEAAEARSSRAAAARAAMLLPGVRQLAVIGPRVGDTELIDGVLIDTGWPLGAALPEEIAGGLPVALYDVSLEAALPEGLDAGVSLTMRCDGRGPAEDPDGSDSAAGAESEALLRRFADGVARAGVRVLGCQQRVAPALVRLLLDRGVLPLPRLSLRHVGAVRRLSGATPLSHLQPPKPSDLGRLAAVRKIERAERTYLHLLPPSARSFVRGASAGASPCPVVTLVLCAPNRSASEELAAVVSSAIGLVGAALAQRRHRLLPAAGCAEILLATDLRRRSEAHSADDADHAGASEGGERARALSRLRRQACALLADALDDGVAALAGGGLRGREALQSLRAQNEAAEAMHRAAGGRSARSFFGWDADAEAPREVLRTARLPAKACDETSSSGGSSSEDDSVDVAHVSTQPIQVECAVVAELESEKLEAIHTAVEVACSVMGVDRVLADQR